MKKILLIAAVALLSIVVALLLCRLPGKSIQSTSEISFPEPTRMVIRVVRELSDLSEFLEDEAEVIIVVEWNVTCQYCKQELLYLELVGTDSTIQVIGLNPYNDPVDQLRYVDENKLSFTMVVGRAERAIPGVPFTQVYLRDGTLCEVFLGWGKDNGPAQLIAIVDRCLDGGTDART